MRLTLSHTTAAAIAFPCFANIAHAGIVVDDFSSVGTPNPWPVTISETGRPMYFVETGLATVLGGSRRTVIAPNPAFSGGFNEVNLTIDPTYGVLNYGSPIFTSVPFALDYYGEEDGLLVDLSGEAGIVIDAIAVNSQNLFIGVTIADETWTATGFAVVEDLLQTPIEIHFEDFFGIEMLDLSHITSFQISFSAAGGSDFMIDSIGTFAIPEPASLALLGASVFVRRRVICAMPAPPSGRPADAGRSLRTQAAVAQLSPGPPSAATASP
jgi:hypothetical protein